MSHLAALRRPPVPCKRSDDRADGSRRRSHVRRRLQRHLAVPPGVPPGGAPVLENTTVIPIDGTEVALNFPTSVASVTITSTPTCGTSLFKGVELFTIDNVIFTAAASGVESHAPCFDATEAHAGRYREVRLHQMLPLRSRRYIDGTVAGLRHVSWRSPTLAPRTVDVVPRRARATLVPNSLQREIAEAGKKSVGVGKCFATSAKKGTPPTARASRRHPTRS